MKIRVRVATTPEGDATRVRAASVGAAGPVRVALSVQTEAAATGGIVRGRGPAFVVRETGGRRLRVADAAALREDFLPVLREDGGDSHLARFAGVRVDRTATAVTGCGNLLTNPGVAATVEGRRYGVEGAEEFAVARAAGEIRVVDGARGTFSDDLGGAPASGPDAWSVAGPVLVRDGRAVPPDPFGFADLRHLLLPAWVATPTGARTDFGLDRLLADPDLRRAAVEGRVVEIELVEDLPETDDAAAPLRSVPIDPDLLRSALRAKGYTETSVVAERGTFRLLKDRLLVAFKEGVYPHHALALDADGAPWSVLVTGRSNREGTTVLGLAAALAESGARDAVLLDNGGDVGLLRRDVAGGLWTFDVRPAEADRARTWPLRACLVWHAPRR